MPPLWDKQKRETFHEAVTRLHKVQHKLKISEEQYLIHHNPTYDDTTAHTLALRDELQLADHIAYLAQTDKKVERISAACVSERPDGLTIRLVSNETPDGTVLAGINGILGLLQRSDGDATVYNRRQGRTELVDSLFNMVVKLDKLRIEQRVRPSSCKSRLKPLWERLQALTSEMESDDDEVSNMRGRLEFLIRIMQTSFPGREGPGDDGLDEALKTTVRECFDISWGGTAKQSLERYFSRCPGLEGLLRRNTRIVREVDKLGRYYGLCRDLAKLSRFPAYRHLFHNLSLESIESPRGKRLQGVPSMCFTHAEVQLVLWNEEDPPVQPNLPPRAIGCSRSACFLCDMFIRQHGTYRISIAHKRLYQLWMVPDVEWMNNAQLCHYRRIMRSMTREIRELVQTARTQHGPTNRQFDLESRAKSPLSSYASLLEVASSDISGPGSTATFQGAGLSSPGPSTPRIPAHGVEEHAVSDDGDSILVKPQMGLDTENEAVYSDEDSIPVQSNSQVSVGTERGPQSPVISSPASRSSSSITSVHVNEQDLPFSVALSVNTPLLHVGFGRVSLEIECMRVTMGKLSITPTVTGSSAAGLGTQETVNVEDIPTDSELRLDCVRGETVLRFRLKYLDAGEVDVEVVWGQYPGWEKEHEKVVRFATEGV